MGNEEMEVYQDTGDGAGFHLVENDAEAAEIVQDQLSDLSNSNDSLSSSDLITTGKVVGLIAAGALLYKGATFAWGKIKQVKENHNRKIAERWLAMQAEAEAKKQEEAPEVPEDNEPEEAPSEE